MSVDDKNEQSVMLSLDELLAQDPSLSGLKNQTHQPSAGVDQKELDRVGLSQDAHRPAAPLTGSAIPMRHGEVKKKGSGKILMVFGGIVGVVALLAVGAFLGSMFMNNGQRSGGAPPPTAPEVIAPAVTSTPSIPEAPSVAPESKQEEEVKPDQMAKPEPVTQPEPAPSVGTVEPKSQKAQVKPKAKTLSKATPQAEATPEATPKPEAAPEVKPEPEKTGSIGSQILSSKQSQKSDDALPAKKAQPSSDLPQQLGRPQILDTLRKNQSSVNRCKAYTDGKRVRLKMRLVIEGSGTVQTAELFEPPEQKGTKLEQCMAERVKLFKFPQFSKPTMVVKLPFVL